MAEGDELHLGVAAVAQRLGVAPSTLRTWDRRYGLGPSQHSAGSHRRYGERDLERLRVMQRLVREGVTPAEAARHALGTDVPAAQPLRRHGGRVLSLPGAEELVRGLGRAAMALDADHLTAALTSHLRDHGVEATWNAVVAPLLVSVGRRWELTGQGVEVEHLVSDCVEAALRRLHPEPPSSPRAVLLACAPNDLHTLPLHAVAAGLAERGVASRLLGASVPGEALAAAVQRLRPPAVLLWSQTRATGSLAAVTDLPSTRPAALVVLGGPGWPSALPPGVRYAESLGAALDLLDLDVGGEALASSG